MRQASLDTSMASMDSTTGVAGASMDTKRGNGEDGVDDIGDYFMQPLTAVDFMQARAAAKRTLLFRPSFTPVVSSILNVEWIYVYR